MSNEDDGPEEEARHPGHGVASPPPYRPPSQFKEISSRSLLPAPLPADLELWLVRIQDNQVKADEFKEKQVKLTLNAIDGKMGCFEDSKGTPFEILDLNNVTSVRPFAFLPKGNSSLEVKRVSRQVAIVRRLDAVTLSRPISSLSQHLSSEMDGRSNVRPSQKGKDAPSMLTESSKGTGLSQVIQESHGGWSVGVGGISMVENVKGQEEKSSPGKLIKKSKRAQPSSNLEAAMSPLASPHEYSDANKQETPSKKSKKNRKTKREESG